MTSMPGIGPAEALQEGVHTTHIISAGAPPGDHFEHAAAADDDLRLLPGRLQGPAPSRQRRAMTTPRTAPWTKLTRQ